MLNNTKGIAMLIVIGLVLMLLILGGTVLIVSTGHFGTSYHQMERTRAYYAAEAAMQHAFWSLRTGCTALPSSGSVNIPFFNDIGKIQASDITITVDDENPPETEPVGVHPVHITVRY